MPILKQSCHECSLNKDKTGVPLCLIIPSVFHVTRSFLRPLILQDTSTEIQRNPWVLLPISHCHRIQLKHMIIHTYFQSFDGIAI